MDRSSNFKNVLHKKQIMVFFLLKLCINVTMCISHDQGLALVIVL